MLKALELSGFKSFADRTRFDFPPGICIVVGPNGSGKSNVVDAVKWVLGSQSAKSLRGKEMMDVIFNGCPTRQPMGTGEVTLTLDNSNRQLAIDADEVYVSRRIYRSGEGEYLINRQPCRLKDVRELLAATGVTTEAYCIIEQGKVDALLQSSPHDRRTIFEEAAGISQFKAKKASAARRMERVEQNLLRLSDIVDEVEGRLRSIRSQAGKARKYRECTERLQQLRTDLALLDWRHFTKQINSRQSQSAELKRRIDERARELEKSDAEVQDLECRIEERAEHTRAIEVEATEVREEIAALQARIDGHTTRRGELQQEIARIREQLAAIDAPEQTPNECGDAALNLEIAESELADALARSRVLSTQLEEARLTKDQAAREFENQQKRVADFARDIALTSEQITALEADVADAEARIATFQQRLAELAVGRETQAVELARCEQVEADWRTQAEQHREALSAAEKRLVDVRRELARADTQHRQMDAQLTRVRERIAVLSELESRLEGLDGGVQEILRVVREEPDHVLGEVRGVVADLFHVDVDSAPLIEVALGERAQHIVLHSTRTLLERIDAQPIRVAGRVGFLGLDGRYALTALDHVDLSQEPGVMGRADQFIESAVEYHGLARRLLGRTWLVDRMATALRLAHSIGRGLEFVTSDGELLSSDGTVVVGPRAAGSGVMSRRSELRACHEQADELDLQLAAQGAICSQLESERVRQEETVAKSVHAYTAAATKLSDCHRQSGAAAARRERLVEDDERLQAELQSIKDHIADSRIEIENLKQKQAAAEAESIQCETALMASEARVFELLQQQSELEAAATELQIAVARGEQRVEMLRQHLDQMQRTKQERQQILAESRQRLAERERQAIELDNTILAGRQSLAELQQKREQVAVVLTRHTADGNQLRSARQTIADRVRDERQQLTTLQSQHHKLEVAITRLNHERQTLCDRMQEDYGIELEEAAIAPQAIESEASAASINRDAVEREISELRDQINNIGAINLEALNELDQLEARFEKLSGQYRDLVDAKAALERITQRINTESRQLFITTLEMVRGHFQELFRRLFGGGEADIVVDESEDVLECGIEIVARPPGKEACSISLLSGGEKTLTCVALLLAVFRSKPSPFCILDEVDAALDEANIGRFTAVLREFLSFTQFIVITHSKKTMSGADTLYGVTMEESGVSKRVAVRFEDVSDDGHILPSAMFRGADTSTSVPEVNSAMAGKQAA